MAIFDTFRVGMIDAQFATYGDAVPFVPASGVGPATVRVILRRPTDEQTLDTGRIVKSKPFIKVPFADVAHLVRDDQLDKDGRRWKIAGAPTRPGDGKVWHADVIDMGPPPADPGP
jgi:hypothetical protein